MITELIVELLALKEKDKGILTGYTVTMIIVYVKTMIVIYSTTIRHLFDTAFLSSTDMGVWY